MALVRKVLRHFHRHGEMFTVGAEGSGADLGRSFNLNQRGQIVPIKLPQSLSLVSNKTLLPRLMCIPPRLNNRRSAKMVASTDYGHPMKA